MHTVHCNTLITASLLVTQDEKRRVIKDAAVAVKDGKILAVDEARNVKEYTATDRMDLGNALVMPGLVNAHTHAAMTLLRGLADDLPLMEWLNQHIFPREKHLTREVVYLGTLLGCAEMMRTGTTAFADMYLIEDAAAEAAELCRMKILAGEGIFLFPSPAYASTEEGYELVRAQARKWADHPLVRVAVMPHAVYTTTPKILQTCRELAEELALPLYIHLAETRTETEACLEAHGMRPVAYCHSLGLLGKTATIAHGVDLTEDELELLAATGTKVVHNPKSNMKLASGVAPVPGMLSHGMLPGLGTDGAASNNSLNLFSEMTACALLHKSFSCDPTVLPAQTALDMATLGSAGALHWEGLGSLTPGGPADLTALDLSSPNMQPLYHPASHLAYAASGHEVMLTMVNGKTLYYRGEYKTLDYPQLLRETARLKQWVENKK